MDYAFAPGGTGFDRIVRGMFSRRANTTLIGARRGRSTVNEFIEHLDASSSITKPIDNILLGTHANSQGYLFTPMFSRQRGPTSFEILEDTISDTTKSISVPDSLIGFTTGDPITKSFHIKGCNIGKATPFLTKMKEAIGGNMNVTAPLHFHGVYFRTSHGTWELMAYEFRLVRKTAFASRAAYITDLNNEGFTFFNGDPVPLADWEAWVPRRIDRPSSVSVNWPLGVTLDRRTTIPFNRSLRYKKDAYTFTITYGSAAQVPSSTTDRMTDLLDQLNNFKYRPTDAIARFDSSHPYPEYERWGYSSMTEFMDEHDWRFTKSGKKLVCKGFFHAYTLLIPITDRVAANAGNLVFNFYPKAGSAIAPINTGLVETDGNFFTTV